MLSAIVVENRKFINYRYGTQNILLDRFMNLFFTFITSTGAAYNRGRLTIEGGMQSSKYSVFFFFSKT